MAFSNVSPRSRPAVDRAWFSARAGLILVAGAALTLGPQLLTTTLIGVAGLILVTCARRGGWRCSSRCLLVQYGERRFERTAAGRSRPCSRAAKAC